MGYFELDHSQICLSCPSRNPPYLRLMDPVCCGACGMRMHPRDVANSCLGGQLAQNAHAHVRRTGYQFPGGFSSPSWGINPKTGSQSPDGVH